MRYYNDKRKYIIGGALLILLVIAAAVVLITMLTRGPGAGDIEDKRLQRIEAYLQVLEADPSDIHALIQIGNIYKTMGDLDRAIEYYNKALKYEPENYEALIELGHAYARKGDYDRAIEIFNRAKKFRPSQPGAYNRLGNVYDDQEKYLKALEEYRKAKKVAPKDQESYQNIARSRLRKGDTKGAIAALEEGIKANPDDPEGYYNLGNLYYDMKKFDTASKNHARAISINTKRSKYHRGLAEDLLKLGKTDDAIASFKQALAVDPSDSLAAERLGDIHAVKEDWPAAVEYYRAALEYNSKDKNLRDKYDAALRKLKGEKPATRDTDKIEGTADRRGTDGTDGLSDRPGEKTSAAEDMPKKPGSDWRLIGDQRRAAKDYEGAIEAYRKAIEADPKDDHSWYWLGRIYYSKKCTTRQPMPSKRPLPQTRNTPTPTTTSGWSIIFSRNTALRPHRSAMPYGCSRRLQKHITPGACAA